MSDAACAESPTWHPIADYDRTREDTIVHLRSGDREAVAYWGVAEGDPEEAWRHADEARDELRVDFEPQEYAEAIGAH